MKVIYYRYLIAFLLLTNILIICQYILLRQKLMSTPSELMISNKSSTSVSSASAIKTTTEASTEVSSVTAIKPAQPKGTYAHTPQQLTGIDISHYQGNLLDEIQDQNPFSFIITKATQGRYYTDPDFHRNWQSLEKMQSIRGTYHFFTMKDNPKKQAEHFFKTVAKLNSKDLSPIVDIEEGSLNGSRDPIQVQKNLIYFIKESERLFKRKPIIYTNYAFAQEFLLESWFSQYKLWIAEYSHGEKPQIPDTWKDTGFYIWQKSSSYHIDSINSDFDTHFGTLATLVQE